MMGLPRSGSTWSQDVFETAPGLVSVREPDNPVTDIFALVGLNGEHASPIIPPDRPLPPYYATLWDLAFRGGWPDHGIFPRWRHYSQKLPRRAAIASLAWAARTAAKHPPDQPTVLVKSVNVTTSIEALQARYRPTVVFIEAHLLNVISSWIAMDWVPIMSGLDWAREARPDILEMFADRLDDPLACMIVNAAIYGLVLNETKERNPEWLVVRHEDLCRDPVGGFRDLFARLGLDFTSTTETMLREHDRPGEGLVTNRRTADQPHRWRRMTEQQLALAQEVLARLPLPAHLTDVAALGAPA